ncbi:MAG: DUF4492 domain-containing protein [Bacteroidales bacterium]|nr:DUF4492 domain-containing protein [Bacteroidales bacterium]
MSKRQNIFKRIVSFYIEGFLSMDVGKKLWLIILIKLFVLFVIFKLFFFQNDLKINNQSKDERSNHVLEQLTNK